MSFPPGEPGFVPDSYYWPRSSCTRRHRLRVTIRLYIDRLTAEPLTHEALHKHDHWAYTSMSTPQPLRDTESVYDAFLHYNCGHSRATLRRPKSFLQKLKQLFRKKEPQITLVEGLCSECATREYNAAEYTGMLFEIEGKRRMKDAVDKKRAAEARMMMKSSKRGMAAEAALEGGETEGEESMLTMGESEMTEEEKKELELQ